MLKVFDENDKAVCEGCKEETDMDDVAQDLEGIYCEPCADALTVRCDSCEVRGFSEDMAPSTGSEPTYCRLCHRDLA